ncbi:MAG: hypothetical protein ACFFE8_17455, partial [Candidatus Heimdallarchaeota archaeon]
MEDEKHGEVKDIIERQAKKWVPWITFIFALFRGLQVFLPVPAFPLITLWDLVALLMAGFYLALLKVQQYSNRIIVLNFISWFVLILPSLVYLPFIAFAPWYILFWLGDSFWYIFIPLVSFLISLFWLDRRRGKDNIKAIHSRFPATLQKIAPEEYLGLVVICFIMLAFFSPRLVTNGTSNNIDYQYEGPQDIITSYLKLEFNSYFPEIPGIVVSTCTGFAAFKLAPNYLGATERALYEQEILTSQFKAKTNVEITVNTTFL